MSTPQPTVSVLRLRVGVGMLLIWWAPFWALAPWLAGILGVDASKLTIAIAVVQTIIGLIGVFIAGQQAAGVVKGLPFRQVPARIWQILWQGTVDIPN